MLIQRLRDGSNGILAKIIVGLIIIVFGLFGFGSITTFLAPVPKVATVNGSDISQQEMEIAVERRRRVLLAQDIPPEEINEDELRTDVLDALISRQVLRQAAADMELQVGDQLLDAEIRETDAFQVDGAFDPDQYRLRLGGAGYTPVRYREEVRADQLLTQMASGIGQSAFLLPGEAARAITLRSQTRDLAWLRIKVAELLPEVTASDAELADYYQQHLETFTTEESVELEYIELKQEDLGVEVTDEDIERHYEDTQGLYSKEESRRVSHILAGISEETDEQQAKANIDAILARLNDGEDFADLAREHSDDPGSAANGGDLGFNEPGIFVKPFEDMVYSLAEQQLSEPVLTQFGYHLIKVTAIEAAHTQPLAEVRDQVEAAWRTAMAREEFVTLSARLGELVFENIDLALPAQELGLTLQTTGPVTRSTGVLGNAEALEAAFSPDVLVDGNNSDVIERSEVSHLALRVLEHTPGEVRQLDAVRQEISDILLREKAATLAGERAAAIVADIEGGSLARYVADQHNLSWEVAEAATSNAPEIDRAILDEAFDLPRPAAGTETVGYTSIPGGDALVVRVSGVTIKAESDLPETELTAWTRAQSGYQGSLDFQEFEGSLIESASLDR